MNSQQLEILHEDNHLLAVTKPAGVLTMGDTTGDVTMVDAAAEYLKVKYNKPGHVFVGVVHRLDRPVSGVLLLARTSKAAGRLSDQFRRGTVTKIYRAVVTGSVTATEGHLTDWLMKDRQTNTVSVVDRSEHRARESHLVYTVTDKNERGTHLRVQPLTGRSHQIRVQLASRGIPIRGDVKYGSPARQGGRISLHAESLEFDHPTTRERLTIVSTVPDDL